MRAERVVGRDGASDQIGALGLHPRIDVLAVITVRPAVEGAILHRRHEVGNQVAAKLVAFVDGGPQRAGLRLPIHPVRIAQPGGEQPRVAGCGIHLQDRGTIDLVLHAVLAHIAVRADRHVEARAIAAGNDVLGPVMVDRARGQVDDLYAGRGDLRIARLVGKAHDRIGVGDIEFVADERHAEGRIQSGQKHGSRVRDAVAVGVAQQRDAVGAGNGRRRRVP